MIVYRVPPSTGPDVGDVYREERRMTTHTTTLRCVRTLVIIGGPHLRKLGA